MFFVRTIGRWFRDRARNLFHYHDGSGWRRGDPVLLGTRLEAVCPDYQSLLDTLATDPNKTPPGPLRDAVIGQRKDAAVKLASVAREVFRLAPLCETGPGGVSEAEAIGVIASFFLFMQRLAEDAELFRDSPGVA